MNHKPNIKQCWKRAVVGINLTTDERRQWPSVKTAAEGCGMQGLLANRIYTEHQARNAKSNKELVKVIAADSVEMADALIAELERTEVRHD